MKHIVLAMFLLAGCAATAQSTGESVMPQYRDKPVSRIFLKWGTPDKSIPAEGGTIYKWYVHDENGNCRLEVHAADPLVSIQPQMEFTISSIPGVQFTYPPVGREEQKVIGFHFAGTRSTCVDWIKGLK